LVETLTRILSKTKLAPRPIPTIEARLEVCLKLHQKPIDNADDVIHGSWPNDCRAIGSRPWLVRAAVHAGPVLGVFYQQINVFAVTAKE
jgi:hypothetical protein